MPSTWKASLDQQLSQRKAESGKLPRIAVLGVGNLSRSDDAAGIWVARGLSRKELVAGSEHILVIEAGQAPENRTGEIRKFAPDLVYIVDAADMGETPGTIRWIAEENIDGMSASTHSLPLSMLARYLKLELNCTVALLGIQVGSNEVGESVHAEVWNAINEIVDGFVGSIHDCFSAYL